MLIYPAFTVREDCPGTEIPAFAQDPMYIEVDVEFLKGLGVHVIQDPAGQRLMGRTTFGFAGGYCPDAEIMDQCVHLHPKLFVGNSVEGVYSYNRLVPW